MSLNDQHHLGEYAPAPKRRVTRARKALIAVMAIGAFAATSGAGTFASFTASTDNASSNDVDGENPFQTGRYELLNTVIDSNGTAISGNGLDVAGNNTAVDQDPNCSSDTDDEEQLEGVAGANDNHAECDYLWVGDENDVVSGITTYVKLENAGDVDTGDGSLIMYVPNPCAQSGIAGLAGDNCDETLLYIQEYAIGKVPGAGNGAPSFTAGGADEVPECVFGRVDTVAGGYTGADADKNADADSNNDGTLDTAGDSPNNEGPCAYGRPLSSLPGFGTGVNGGYVTIDGVLPAADGTATVNENNDVRYFKIFAKAPTQAECGSVTEPAYNGADDDTENTGAGNGFHDTTGLGCHNSIQNTGSVFTLRWMLIA